MTKQKQLGCDYEGNDFGAHYLDSKCINGYLWDMDSGFSGEDGQHYLDIGGDIPCPHCNAKQYVKSYLADALCDAGYESLSHPLSPETIKNPFKKWPSNRRRMGQRYWRAGRREAIKEAKMEG